MKEKKTNFFRELVDPTSTVSSKRFAGLILLGLFGVASVASVFIDLDAESLQLIKADGVLGAALLGVNAIESSFINGFKNKKEKKDVKDSK